MKILVTGGTGKIGQEICKNLIFLGHEPICFARKNFGLYPVIEGDIRSKNDVKKAVQGFDYIIHAAAAKRNKSKREIISTNIYGTMNLIDFCNNIPIKIISSIEAFNLSLECYGASKLIIEEISKEYNNISFIRLPTVWGSEATLVSNWLQSAKNTGKILLYEFSKVTKKKFFITLQDAGELCSDLQNKNVTERQIRVIDCRILATAIQHLTNCTIEIVKMQGLPYEYLSRTICSKDIESISIDETKNIIIKIYGGRLWK
jgi:nucleoside-diphosphate-sugar epimerase